MGYFLFPTRNLKSHTQKYNHHILHHKLFFFPKKQQQQQLPLMFVFFPCSPYTKHHACLSFFWGAELRWLLLRGTPFFRRRSWEDCEDVATSSMDSVTSLVDQAWNFPKGRLGEGPLTHLGLLLATTPNHPKPHKKKGIYKWEICYEHHLVR